MQNYFIKTIAASCLVLLVSCQNGGSVLSGPGPGNLFNGGGYPPELSLTQSVQDALIRSDDPVIAQVHVQTNQSTVILSGYVKKIKQSDVAQQLAQQVPGVQRVENHLIVRQ